MCGLVAVLSRTRPVDRDAVVRATGALEARGPDAAGYWFGPEVGLGHRRLAIVDLEGGAQPLASEAGDVHAVVNGELYDAASLRAGLEQRGHRFATRSDSELIVHLYAERGTEALAALRGEFAFVLWDATRRRLFAARDRFGVKPLCFTEHDGALWIASQAKALFAAGVPARWNHDALEHTMRMQYPLPGTTLFRGVRELEPGHCLLADEHGTTVHKYWDLDYPIEPAEPAGDAAARFRSLFEDAVRVRLAADVPVAFQLSGGIDSSSVAAVAARALGAVDCFTVRFEGAPPPYDEVPQARAIADALGARHHVVPVSSRDLTDWFPAAVVAGEGLVINAHGVGKFLLSRAVRAAGFKVVLTGEGADEVLAGYAHLRSDLGHHDVLASNAASRGIMLPDGAGLSLDAVERRLGFVPTWLRAKATFGHRLVSLLERPVALDAYAALLDHVDLGQLRGRGRVEQSLWLWSKTALESYILRTLGDAMELAHSVEGRLPFLDSRLFDFVRTLPTHHKIAPGGREKHVLREAMRGLLPDAVVDREKHPFLAPPMFDAGLRGLLEDTLDQLPGVDAAAVRAQLAREVAPAERATWDPVFFFLTSACILQRRWGLT